MNRCIKLVARL